MAKKETKELEEKFKPFTSTGFSFQVSSYVFPMTYEQYYELAGKAPKLAKGKPYFVVSAKDTFLGDPTIKRQSIDKEGKLIVGHTKGELPRATIMPAFNENASYVRNVQERVFEDCTGKKQKRRIVTFGGHEYFWNNFNACQKGEAHHMELIALDTIDEYDPNKGIYAQCTEYVLAGLTEEEKNALLPATISKVTKEDGKTGFDIVAVAKDTRTIDQRTFDERVIDFLERQEDYEAATELEKEKKQTALEKQEAFDKAGKALVKTQEEFDAAGAIADAAREQIATAQGALPEAQATLAKKKEAADRINAEYQDANKEVETAEAAHQEAEQQAAAAAQAVKDAQALVKSIKDDIEFVDVKPAELQQAVAKRPEQVKDLVKKAFKDVKFKDDKRGVKRKQLDAIIAVICGEGEPAKTAEANANREAAYAEAVQILKDTAKEKEDAIPALEEAAKQAKEHAQDVAKEVEPKTQAAAAIKTKHDAAIAEQTKADEAVKAIEQTIADQQAIVDAQESKRELMQAGALVVAGKAYDDAKQARDDAKRDYDTFVESDEYKQAIAENPTEADLDSLCGPEDKVGYKQYNKNLDRLEKIKKEREDEKKAAAAKASEEPEVPAEPEHADDPEKSKPKKEKKGLFSGLFKKKKGEEAGKKENRAKKVNFISNILKKAQQTKLERRKSGILGNKGVISDDVVAESPESPLPASSEGPDIR